MEDGRAVHSAQKGSLPSERGRQDTYVTLEPKRKLVVPFSLLPKAHAINQLQQEATKLRRNHTQNHNGRKSCNPEEDELLTFLALPSVVCTMETILKLKYVQPVQDLLSF